MAEFKFTNNFVPYKIAAGISAVDTAINVEAGKGVNFPSPAAGQEFRSVLFDALGNVEVIKVTTRVVDAFTVIVRAQEGTAARAWLANDSIQLRLTKETMDNFLQKDGASNLIVGATPLAFDGTTAGTFKTSLAVTDPTANNTITVQNASGTIPLLEAMNSWTVGIGPSYIQNIGLTATVAVKALTISLKTKALSDPSAVSPQQTTFRNAILTTGDYVVRSATSATSLVVPSGASLGFASSEEGIIYVYELDNAGTIELACSKSSEFDETTVQSTTAISATSDFFNVLYSTSVLSNVPIKLIGKINIITGAVAGEWDNAPTIINIYNGNIKNSLIDRQTFDNTGTWYKPAGFNANSLVILEAWGGGGSGGKGDGGIGDPGGGGGGAYMRKEKLLSSLGATETIIIGNGGASVSGIAQNGNQGGTTTISSQLTAYGGGRGGGTSPADCAGGGGAGEFGSGGNATATTPGVSGFGLGIGGGSGGGAGTGGSSANTLYAGGGGGGGGGGVDGGKAYWGGGGGSGDGGASNGGLSINGGTGGANSSAGSVPGGGGGGSTNGASGAGGKGRAIITVYNII